MISSMVLFTVRWVSLSLTTSFYGSSKAFSIAASQRKQFAIIYALMYLMELCDVIAGTYIDSRHNSVNHQ